MDIDEELYRIESEIAEQEKEAKMKRAKKLHSSLEKDKKAYQNFFVDKNKKTREILRLLRLIILSEQIPFPIFMSNLLMVMLSAIMIYLGFINSLHIILLCYIVFVPIIFYQSLKKSRLEVLRIMKRKWGRIQSLYSVQGNGEEEL